MKYIVTGGLGFIGSHLVDKLIGQGDSVTVIDDLSSGKRGNLSCHKKNKRLQIYQESICNDLTDIFKKGPFDVVFHFAALPKVQYSIKNPIKTHQVNVEGTLNILSLCTKFKARRLIFASSSSIYGDQNRPLRENIEPKPLSPYALQKLIGEYYCKLFTALYGLDTVILRYFNVFGPRQSPEGDYGFLIPKFITLVKAGKKPTIYGDGLQTRDFIYISDVVEATLLAANTNRKKVSGKTFNVAYGREISVNEVAKKIIALSNKKMTPSFGSPRIEPKHTSADISFIKRTLGWKQITPFEKGLKECLKAQSIKTEQ